MDGGWGGRGGREARRALFEAVFMNIDFGLLVSGHKSVGGSV